MYKILKKMTTFFRSFQDKKTECPSPLLQAFRSFDKKRAKEVKGIPPISNNN